MSYPRLEVWAPAGFPRLEAPCDLGPLIVSCLQLNALLPRAEDVLVVAHKVISKAEGRVVELKGVTPSPRALELAARTDKDPALVEVILRETRRLVRVARGVILCENHLGVVCANAGVDRSNAGEERAVLLPEDPDRSARQIRQALHAALGVKPAVLVADTHGRPWREGAVGLCLGLAGLEPFRDYRGRRDLFAYEMQSEVECCADELCAAATLAMGQGREGRPLALIRGFQGRCSEGASGHSLLREPARDLFR